MLLDARGRQVVSASVTHHRPQPNEEAEGRVRALLKSMDSLLDVRWFPAAYYNAKHKDYEGRYGLICTWPQTDKRWEMYHSGEIGEPFDILGWFCEDIHDAESIPRDVDSMERLVVELLGKCDNERFPWRQRMAELVGKNAALRKSRQQEMIDRAEDVAKTLWQAVGRHDATKVERIMKEVSEGAE